MVYNGNVYYFRKNVLGDVTDIFNSYGTLYASYAYDAWGNCTITYEIGGIGVINPFRYRGYYYDTETGFYYLQSRYYDPTIRRFINSDDLELLPTLSQTIGQLNLYAYCNNNPIMYADPSGELFLSAIISGILGGVYGGITAYIKGENIGAGIIIGMIGGTILVAFQKFMCYN